METSNSKNQWIILDMIDKVSHNYEFWQSETTLLGLVLDWHLRADIRVYLNICGTIIEKELHFEEDCVSWHVDLANIGVT